jgi:endo-1,4-beta-xylanase
MNPTQTEHDVISETFGRRRLLKALFGSVATMAVGTRGLSLSPIGPNWPLSADASAPLRAVAESRGLIYGAAALRSSLSDPSYSKLFAQQCGILVPEGALKWDSLRPAPDKFDFGDGDALYDYARSHNMLFRGHNLAWHEALPKWFQSEVNATNAEQVLVEHIRKVVGHYSGKIHSWDVVNEIVQPNDKRPDGLTNSPWLKLLGPDYIDLAFRATAEADPKALRVWNENWLEADSAYSQQKRTAVLSLLKDLKRRGTPVQALGLEAHLFADLPIAKNLGQFLTEVTDLGLKILITELDIRDRNLPAALDIRDQTVADKYFEFLSTVLSNERVIAVLTWGLSDRYSWINKPGAPANTLRPDKIPSRPLPFDSDLRPKQVFTAMERAFSGAPKRELLD